MKEMKRHLAIILASCLIFTIAVPVFAAEETAPEQSISHEEATPDEAKYENEEIEDDTEEASQSDAENEDEEFVCGFELFLTAPEATPTEVTTWASLSEALRRETDDTIMLGGDITATGDDLTLTVSGTKTLDLNGHKIDASHNDKMGSIISVENNSELTIMDGDDGGAITGCKNAQISDTRGGGVRVIEGTLNLLGGTISNNSANNGGGVYVKNGTFNMEGGSITGNGVNSSVGFGGGVYVADGNFTMTGGSITNNTAMAGAGVSFLGSTESTFNMMGGTISNNSADNGGGGVLVGINVTMSMSGGTISNNKATENGGGVYSMGSINLGGTAQVTGNTVNSVSNNIYLQTGRILTIRENVDAPEDGMNIGVTTEEIPYPDPVRITANCTPEDSKYFFADDSEQRVIFVSNYLALYKVSENSHRIYIGTFDNGSVTYKSPYAEKDSTVALTVTPDTGCALKSLYYTPDGDEAVDITRSRSFIMPDKDVTITAVFERKPFPDPKKKGSSGSTYTLFTGTWGNPVTNGTWRYDPETDTWSYTTTHKFTETWGYIANPYANDEPGWFYFDRNGNMLTGWHWLYWNGTKKCYYFNPSRDSRQGKCQLGGVTPDGYTVDETGAWTVNGVVQTTHTS